MSKKENLTQEQNKPIRNKSKTRLLGFDLTSLNKNKFRVQVVNYFYIQRPQLHIVGDRGVDNDGVNHTNPLGDKFFVLGKQTDFVN